MASGKLSSTQLTALQAVATASLDQTCQIQRKAPARDAYGSESDGYANHGAAVACNLAQPTSGQMQNYDYLIGNLATWQVRLPYGTDVQRDDQLVISGAGLTLRVQAVLGPHSYPVCVHVLASEVR